MKDTVQEILDLQEKVKKQDRACISNQIHHTSLMEVLKERFNCSSLKEAQTLLKEKKKKRDALNKKIASRMSQFKKEWDEYL